ncbi:MAG: DUF2231 domain-containing protein [Syntrophothermus sp.]
MDLSIFHPKVVHFAVALLLTYSLLEIIGVLFNNAFFQKTALLILLLGVLGAFAAVTTGREAEDAFDYFNSSSSDTMESHETFANITFWFFLIVLLFRGTLLVNVKLRDYFYKIRYVFLILAIIGAFFVFQTGQYGGELVYTHGVGTKIKIQQMENKINSEQPADTEKNEEKENEK